MNMWVSARTSIPTSSEIAARRARLMGCGKVVNIAVKREHNAKLTIVPQLVQKRPDIPADAHVKAYEDYLAKVAECPSAPAYVRMRCKALGIPYEEVTDTQIRSHSVVLARRRLIKEVKTRFPQMSSKAIALVFGEMHHTAVLKAIGRGDHKWRGLAAGKIAEIKRMHTEGMSYREIAAAVGVNYGTVQNHLKPEYRKLRDLRRRKGEKA